MANDMQDAQLAAKYLSEYIEGLFPPMLRDAITRLLESELLRLREAPSHDLTKLLRNTRNEERGLYLAFPWEASLEDAAFLMTWLDALRQRWQMRLGDATREQKEMLRMPYNQVNYACELAIAEANRSRAAASEQT